MEEIKSYSSLSGLERVSLLMLSLSDKHVGKLFSFMEETEIKDITKTMTGLGKISSDIVESVLMDFIDEILSSGSVVGSLESTKRILLKIMPEERVNGLLADLKGPAGRTMWDKLSNINEELLSNYLKSEYPQTIAVVLSRIRPEHAAKVIPLLPESLTLEVMLRMLRMDSIRKEVLDDIERTLRIEFVNNVGGATQRDSFETMADIFNYMDRTNESRYLGALEERNADVVERIKQLMFTFDDILRINNPGIQAIIRVSDKTKLALALKGGNEGVKALFFSNMSERSGKIMKDEMDSMGMVKVKDVDDAQTYVVSIAKELANSGELVIKSANEAEEQLIG